jgi:hypothetical protein
VTRLTRFVHGNYRGPMSYSPIVISAGLAVALLVSSGCSDATPHTGPFVCPVPIDLGACTLAPAVGLAKPTSNPELLTRDCTELSHECLLPYPSSAFLRVDETTPSGRRITAPAALSTLGLDPAEMERADGFSRVTPIVTHLPSGVSAQGLPLIDDRVAAYTESTADDSPIFVVIADATSARYGERVPFIAEAVESESVVGETLLVITPLEPLAPATRYAVVVTSRVLDRCGDPSSPGETMRALLADSRPAGDLGALWDQTRELRYLAEVELGLAPCEIVELWDFWTRSDEDVTRDLLSMRATVLDWLSTEPTQPVITEITSGVDGSTRFDFTYTGPTFRIDAASGLARDEAGLPVIVGEETLHGILIVPVEATDTSPAVPVTMGHGFGMDGQQMCMLARSTVIARGTYALGCFDWELHGHRGGGASAILDLLVPSSLPSLASVFQQSAVDELVFSEALRVLADDPEVGGRVDTSHHLYAGVSMGGVVGGLATAIDDAMDASVLNVPGGGIVHLVRHSDLFETLGIRGIARSFVESNGSITGLPVDLEAEVIVVLSQFTLDESDPANWGAHLVAERLVGGAPPVLIQESMGDGIVPNFTTELLARSAGFPLVAPYLESVPGLEVVTAPTGGSPHHGLTQFYTSQIGYLAHLAFSHASVQAQLFAFFDSVIDEDPSNDGDIRFP